MDHGTGRSRTGHGRTTTALTALVLVAVTLLAVPRPAGAGPSTAWQVVPAPRTAGDDIMLGSACPSTVSCWAVGITILGLATTPTFAPLVERWSGGTWALGSGAAPPGGAQGGLFDVACVTVSDCWAVGAVIAGTNGGSPTGTLTEHWDGHAWSVVPSPTPTGAAGGILEHVTCVGTRDCWAVGFDTDGSGGALHALIERWDGAAWSIVPGGATGQAFDQLDSVTCVSPTSCWAVGAAGPVQQNPNFLPIFPAAATDQGLIERWDGTTWSVVPGVTAPAPTGGYLSDVTCTDGTSCLAVGSVTTAAGTAGQTLAEAWDGARWTRVPTPDADPTGGNILGAVACVGPTRCWAAGSSGSFGGGGGSGFQPRQFVEQWDGTSWVVDPSPSVGVLGFLDTLTCMRTSGCWAAGSAATQPNENDPGLQSLLESTEFPAPVVQGLHLGSAVGGVYALGAATFEGALGSAPAHPVVGMAATPDGGGYWLVASDGGVFAFGDAAFSGSLGATPLNRPIVGMAATPDGGGYWLVASDGGVFAFGDAAFSGSLGATPLNRPIVGMAATPDGGGYWLVASDGGVFAFGDAAFSGSLGATPLNRPIVGMAATPDGGGYWLVASDGGVFAFGDAAFSGSLPDQVVTPLAPVVALVATPDGGGYWVVSSDGGVFAYGDAWFPGSLVRSPPPAPVTAAAP